MRKIFTKKKIIWTIILLAIAGGTYYYQKQPKSNKLNIQSATVTKMDLEQTVLSTGQVVSETNLGLSFQNSGIVEDIKVVVGDKVKKGDVLAILSQANAKSSLTSANGQLAQAEANYKKIIAGSSDEQINVAQKSVDAARVSYNNALSQLNSVENSSAANIKQLENSLADLSSPTTTADNKRSAIIVTIANQLTALKSDLDKENQILSDENLKDTFGAADFSSLLNFKSAISQVKVLLDSANYQLGVAQAYKSDDNIYQAVTTSLAALTQNINSLNYCYTALQNSVPNMKFSQVQLDTHKSTINLALANENSGTNLIKSSRQALTDALTAAENNVTNSKLSATTQINSAQNQINSARAALLQAEASLAQQKAKARPADIEAAQAQLLSARGTVEAAQNNLENTILKAPADGTITQIDTKVGQQINAMSPIFILQDIESLHAEAYISEANVASLALDQTIDYTLDSLGPDNHFNGKILTVNPASTVISGVVNYLVKASLPKIMAIKPGMTINMTVLIAERKDALSIPSTAIINEDSKQYVRLIDDVATKTYHQVAIKTGLQADGGQVEILEGLSEGQEVVTLIK